MRLSGVVITTLIVLGSTSALKSPSTAGARRRHPGSPLPLPPEQTSPSSNTAIDQIPIKIHTRTLNFTLPLPPSPTPLTPPSPTPLPLDTSISYSLSNSCLLYLTSLLTSTTFESCLPLSLLLTTSSAYSSMVTKAGNNDNYTTLNNLISYTANPQPSGDQCDTYMSGVLDAIQQKGNCASDLGSNVVAKEAKLGVGNYGVVRKASGLIDPDTGVYCYLEALASDRPDDLYLWNLPAGISVPSTFSPTCSKCSASLLNTYISSIPTTSTLNSTIVKTAVDTVNSACGTGFVVYSANTAKASSAQTTSNQGLLFLTAGLIGCMITTLVGGFTIFM